MSLEDEIEMMWSEVEALHEKGLFKKYIEEISFTVKCHDLDFLKKKSEIIGRVSSEMENYSSLNYPGPKRQTLYKELEFLRGKLEFRKREISNCIKNKIYKQSYLEKDREKLEEITLNIENEHLYNLLEDNETERFGRDSFKNDYDREYILIKRRFDKIPKHKESSLGKLKKLAQESESLTDKYKSINDREGASKAALLHEDIEKHAEYLSPIYESWKVKRVTVGLALLAATLGFWKGNYVKEQVKYFLSGEGNETISSTADSLWNEYVGPMPLGLTDARGEKSATYSLSASLEDNSLKIETEDSVLVKFSIVTNEFEADEYNMSTLSAKLLENRTGGKDFVKIYNGEGQMLLQNDSVRKSLEYIDGKLDNSHLTVEQ